MRSLIEKKEQETQTGWDRQPHNSDHFWNKYRKKEREVRMYFVENVGIAQIERRKRQNWVRMCQERKTLTLR